MALSAPGRGLRHPTDERPAVRQEYKVVIDLSLTMPRPEIADLRPRESRDE